MRSLSRAVLIGDAAEASFVAFGLDELAQRFGVPLVTTWDEVTAASPELVVAVGRRTLEAGGLDPLVAAGDPGPEGYAIAAQEWGGVPVVALAGSDAHGTKFAMLDVLRSAVAEPGGWSLPDDLERRTAPALRLRAMYAHLHWSYNRPYALRSWTPQDWRDYVDLLSHFGVNVLQIWPMLGLMPLPISADDEAWLRGIADVVDYAHEARGMQVWVGECCNNLASTDQGRPLADRSYFGAELLVDPGTEEGLAAIEESRRHLYRLVPNADAYWIIDSDPGQWPGSTSEEFVEVVVRNQRLMQEYNTTGARIVYWMHVGWGTGTYEENFEATLRGLQERLDEPWSVLIGALPQHPEVVKRLGLDDRVVWFPYGWIEGEPTPPLTQFSFDWVDDRLQAGLELGVTGAMGQAQTPVLQLPKLWYLFRNLWDPSLRAGGPEPLLRELAGHLYRDCATEVADAWMAMTGTDAAVLGQARDALAKVVETAAATPGAVGRHLFGCPEIVAEDLLAQLAIKHEGEAFRDAVVSDLGVEVVQEHFTNYLRAALRWRERPGYVPLGGFKFLYGPYLDPGTAGWNQYFDVHGFMHAYPEVQWVPKARLIDEGEFHWALIDGVLNEVVAQPGARRA